MSPEEENISKNANSHISTHSNLLLYEDDGSTKNTTLAAYLSTGAWGPSRAPAQRNMERNQRTMESMELNQIIAGTPHPIQTTSLPMDNKSSKGASSPGGNPDKGKLGMFSGVYIPTVSNIYGVMLFVRYAWIVGNAGIGQALLLVTLSALCTLLTTLSMSAIVTNGKVAAGGAYYIVSRSLGKEFGGSVGLLFCLANAVGCSMYALGAVEVLTNNIAPEMSFKIPGTNIEDPYMNARVYGSVIVFFLGFIVLVGISLVSRAAVFFTFSVILAILAGLIGLFASNRPGLIDGIIGFPGNFIENFPPAYNLPDTHGVVANVSFFELFGIFFPCVTDVLGGSNFSGDLKDPQKDIPAGTLAAHITTTITYATFIVLFGTVVNGDLLREKIPDTGLLMASVAWPSRWVVLIGCLLSSFGAGLQCLVGAPRLFQALAKDDIIPFLRVFGKLSKPIKFRGVVLIQGGEPRLAFFLTLLITEGVVLIGNLEPVANIVTMLFLITYLFVNASTALLGFIKSPNWRPSWKYYHWSLSLFGSVLCLAFMFMISWVASLLALGLMFGFYKYIEYRGAKVQWGDGVKALNLQIARKNLYDAEKFERLQGGIVNDGTELRDIKNWRPQIIGFVETVNFEDQLSVKNSHMLDFLSQLRKGGGLTVVASIILGDTMHNQGNSVKKFQQAIASSCDKRKLEAFTSAMISPSLKYGILSMVQCYGVGVLKPNTVVIGYPVSWRVNHDVCVGERYVGILCNIIEMDKALVILKGDEKFPSSKQKGTIDVYWVMHDGGILTLLSHLLRKHSVWKDCKLRIFAISQLKDNSVAMKENLAQSLKFLRIDAEAHVLELGDYDISDFAYERTIKMREREELLKRVKTDKNVLVLPNISTKNLFPTDSGNLDDDFTNIPRKTSAGSIVHRFRNSVSTNQDATKVDKGDSGEKVRSDQHLVPGGVIPTNDNSQIASSSPSSEKSVNLKQMRDDSAVLYEKRINMMNTSVKLNNLMKMNSGNENCKLIFANLPAPTGSGAGSAISYLEYLEALTDGFDKMVLIKGTGTEVVTTFF